MRYVPVFSAVVFFALALLAAEPKSVWDGVYTKEQAQEGANLYDDKCVMCHGEPDTGGDSGPSLSGEGFRDNWKGKTAADLFLKMSKQMPMDDPGSLQPEEYASLMAFLFFENRFPLGQEDLAASEASLRQIRMEAKKAEAKK